MRRVTYITGTRADFGLMKRTLDAIREHPGLSVDVIATGMHLAGAYGNTMEEVVASGVTVKATIPLSLEPANGATMGGNIGRMTTAITEILAQDPPDLVLLLGDRGEMLAGAIASIHLGIPVAHVCGGERSGTVDEPVRHAVSKLSHLHFTATDGARDRLIRMGEDGDRVWTVGAPGLDGLAEQPIPTREALLRSVGLSPSRPVALLVYHPVLQEAEASEQHTRSIIEVLLKNHLQVVALSPNADAGSDGVRAALNDFADAPGFVLKTHLPRQEFIAFLAVADLMAGNSSAGIVEAATFGTPVLNIGSRQNLRERNANVLDVSADAADLDSGVKALLGRGRFPPANVYRMTDGGTAADRIAELLATVTLDDGLLFKVNAY